MNISIGFHFQNQKSGIFQDFRLPRQRSTYTTVPEFIDPVFTKTIPKRSFSLNRKRAFWLVFAKTGSIISGTVQCTEHVYIFSLKK